MELSDELGSQYSSICTEDILNDESIMEFGIQENFSDQLDSFANTFTKQTIWGTEFYICEILKSFLLDGSYKLKTNPMTSCSNGFSCSLCEGTIPRYLKVISINYGTLSEKCKWYLKTFAPEIMTILHKYFKTDVTFHNLELASSIHNFIEINNSLISIEGSVFDIEPLKRETYQCAANCEQLERDSCDKIWKNCGCTKIYHLKFEKLYHHFRINQSSMSV